MTLYKGIVCAKSKSLGRNYMTRDECNLCVQSPDHPCPFHGKMLARLWGDYDNEPAAWEFSPTRVQGCDRKKWFVAHADEYDQLLDPSTAYHAMRGHFVHNFFEQDTPPAPGTVQDIIEIRFKSQINTKYGTQLFQGKPDLIEIKEDRGDTIVVKVVDWKSIREIKHDFLEARKSHQFQVNMYAWLLFKELPKFLNRKVSVIVDELEIVYLDMGKVRRFTTKCDLVDRGKIKAPRRLKEYEPLPLKKLNLAKMERMGTWIVRQVEKSIEEQRAENPAPPLEGDEARLCDYCSFQAACVKKYEEDK